MGAPPAGSTSPRGPRSGAIPVCGWRSAGCWCVTRLARRNRRPSSAPTSTPSRPTSCAGSPGAGGPKPHSKVRGTAPDRRHLGLESQRQWTDLAVLRTTPALLGLFSLVTLWASQLAAERGPMIEYIRWYPKPLPTFSDALALVRRELWAAQVFATSPAAQTARNVPADLVDRLLLVACRPP